MVVVVKKVKQESESKAAKVVAENKIPSKGFDAKKYAGKIKFPVDGLTYQKQVRDEWE